MTDEYDEGYDDGYSDGLKAGGSAAPAFEPARKWPLVAMGVLLVAAALLQLLPLLVRDEVPRVSSAQTHVPYIPPMNGQPMKTIDGVPEVMIWHNSIMCSEGNDLWFPARDDGMCYAADAP